MYSNIPLNTHGYQAFDVTKIGLKVGQGYSDSVRVMDEKGVNIGVAFCGLNLRESTDIVDLFNADAWPELERELQLHYKHRGTRFLMAGGLALWMGVTDAMHSVPTKAPPIPTLQLSPTHEELRAELEKVDNYAVLVNSDDTVYATVLGGEQPIMYGAGRGAALSFQRAFNAGNYSIALSILKAHPAELTGWGEYVRDKLAVLRPNHDDAIGEDSFGIGAPAAPKQWEPDVPDPSVDLMKSIRDACTR